MPVVAPPLPSIPSPGPRFYMARPFTVSEYHRLADAGILQEGSPVELLEGRIVFKMTRNPPHDVALGLTGDAVTSRLPAGWHVREQSAVTTDDSEPEPDLAVARGLRRDYAARHPRPGDLALVIEIAESSLAGDREDKGRIYARAGIPVYWIVNLVNRQVEVYTDPTGATAAPAYRQRNDYRIGDTVPFQASGLPPTRIPVADLLP